MRNKALSEVAGIKEYLANNLVFMDREAFVARREGCLQLALGLQGVDGTFSVLGYVSRIGNRFWWFTNHPMIITRGDPADTHRKLDDAERALYEYVYSECFRILCDGAGIQRFHQLPKRAHAEAETASRGADVLDQESYLSGFTNGYCKAVTLYGLAANPKWAKFLVQHRDGSFTWFEHKPYCDHNTGRWFSKSGRKRNVLMTNSWSHSLRRL